MDVSSVTLALGPLLFNWNPNKTRDFYFRMADESPIDIVYLGETICRKREPFLTPMYPAIIERLQRAGKKVILSTLQLVMDSKDMASIEETVKLADDFMIEANDISATSLLKGQSHAVGPSVNIYNKNALHFFERCGAQRVSLNCELSAKTLKILAQGTTAKLEVQVFGRTPLAISARCYHARGAGLAKSGCQYVCEKDTDGLQVDTVDGQAFLAINGLQTLSFKYINLAGELPALSNMGISSFRLSPHDTDMVKICNIFKDRLDNRINQTEANQSLSHALPEVQFSNGFYHDSAGHTLHRTA